jgi:asparagine synthase (glutamine-hydrolysing)
MRGMRRLERRGPDGEGVWSAAGVIMGHRRLAVIDLNPRAAQPMASECGRFTIVFNGEIYNYRAIKHKLEAGGAKFHTTSDTEVLLHLFARRGEKMLDQLRGMFALAIWDSQRQALFVARDPYGIKPLYLAHTSDGTWFASQTKALLDTGCVSREPDPRGQAGYWLLGSVPEPATWHRDIRALPAGHYIWIDSHGRGQTTQWWDIGDAWRRSFPAEVGLNEAREGVRSALRQSIEAHLVSDVPVGIFLSGGIDSSSLAALMREAGEPDLYGVTVRFGEHVGTSHDESRLAAEVAAKLRITHHVRTVTGEEFARDLPRILSAMDQPTIDGVNTWYASKAARESGLKVVISGIGGDELFQGYSSFSVLPRIRQAWKRIRPIPGMLALARAAAAVQHARTGNPRWRSAPDLLGSIEGAWLLQRGLFAVSELPEVMGRELAGELMSKDMLAGLVRGMVGDISADDRLALSQIESMTYLRNQLLRDSDWASMDHGLELRTPLVDSWLLRDVGFALGVFSLFPNKQLLAQAPVESLSRKQMERKKTGFAVPMHRWLIDTPGARDRAGTSRQWARVVADRVYQPT